MCAVLLTVMSHIQQYKLPVVVGEGQPRFPIVTTAVNFGLFANNNMPFPHVDHVILVEPSAELEVVREAPVLSKVTLGNVPVSVCVKRAAVSKLELI